MEELGFTSLASDAGVFYYRGEGSFIVTIIYVDDTIFCGPSKSLVLKFKEAFMKRWETRDLGEVTDTGGKGSITQWVHAEYMEGSETICPTFTRWVRGGYFSKVPTKVPTG